MKRATVKVMAPDFEMDSEGGRGWESSVEDCTIDVSELYVDPRSSQSH